MASFLDNCVWNATSTGTGDFVVATAVAGSQTPASANAVNAAIYRYYARSSDSSQWEIGYGAYTVAGTSQARTTVLFNSSGTTAKISFTTVPIVAMVALAEDLGALAVGQIPGTATNDSASAGNVGEYAVSVIVSGSAVALTNNVTANLTSLNLAAGDWDVEAVFYTVNGGTTTFSFMEVAINGTSATLPTRAVDGSNGVKAGSNAFQNYSGGAGLNQTLAAMPTRVSLSAAINIYAVVNATFSASTCSIYGVMRARRVR